MAQQYETNLKGVLFKNDRKESEKHPDYKGSCEIEGTEYWISAWIKEGKTGKFMSLSFKVKEDAKPAQKKTKVADDDLDSDIPF